MELNVEVSQPSTDETVLALTGSLDLTSRDQLIEAGGKALTEGSISRLVLDLAGLTFMDSTGIGAVVEVAGGASDRGVAFALRSPSERIFRVLQLTGMADLWPIESAPQT